MNKCLNFSSELITSIKIFEEELELTRRVLASSNFDESDYIFEENK